MADHLGGDDRDNIDNGGLPGNQPGEDQSIIEGNQKKIDEKKIAAEKKVEEEERQAALAAQGPGVETPGAKPVEEGDENDSEAKAKLEMDADQNKGKGSPTTANPNASAQINWVGVGLGIGTLDNLSKTLGTAGARMARGAKQGWDFTGKQVDPGIDKIESQLGRWSAQKVGFVLKLLGGIVGATNIPQFLVESVAWGAQTRLGKWGLQKLENRKEKLDKQDKIRKDSEEGLNKLSREAELQKQLDEATQNLATAKQEAAKEPNNPDKTKAVADAQKEILAINTQLDALQGPPTPAPTPPPVVAAPAPAPGDAAAGPAPGGDAVRTPAFVALTPPPPAPGDAAPKGNLAARFAGLESTSSIQALNYAELITRKFELDKADPTTLQEEAAKTDFKTAENLKAEVNKEVDSRQTPASKAAKLR